MSSPLTLVRLCLICFVSSSSAQSLVADDRVAVVANADVDYTARKFGEGKARRETYVVMQGRFHGGATSDKTLERMSIRQVVSYLIPKLAEREFVPAKSVDEADLMLAVHWGVTNPRVGRLELAGRTSVFTPSVPAPIDPNASAEEQERVEALNHLLGAEDRSESLDHISDFAAIESSQRDLAQLLGYSEVLSKFGSRMVTTTDEQMLRYDLARERYFIIVRAYELKIQSGHGKPRRPAWTIHLNVSSPGNNFRTAMMRMSHVAPEFVGRTSDNVESVRARAPSGNVDLGDLIIVGMER